MNHSDELVDFLRTETQKALRDRPERERMSLFMCMVALVRKFTVRSDDKSMTLRIPLYLTGMTPNERVTIAALISRKSSKWFLSDLGGYPLVELTLSNIFSAGEDNGTNRTRFLIRNAFRTMIDRLSLGDMTDIQFGSALLTRLSHSCIQSRPVDFWMGDLRADALIRDFGLVVANEEDPLEVAKDLLNAILYERIAQRASGELAIEDMGPRERKPVLDEMSVDDLLRLL